MPIGRRPQRSAARAARWILACLVAVFIVTRLSAAYQATKLREADLPALREAAERSPYDDKVLALLAGREAQALHFSRAAELCQRAVASGNTDSLVWLTWAASHAAAGNIPLSKATLMLGGTQPALSGILHSALDRVQKLPPDAPPARVAAAIYPEGPKRLVQVYSQGSFLNGLFRWYGHRHPGSSGCATREEWASAEPNSAQAQILWAETLIRNEQYNRAETVARHALELSPASLSAHLTFADALYGEGYIGKAGIEYAQTARAHPTCLAALLGLGRVSLDKQLIPISLDVYQKATKLAPSSADAWIGLGRARYSASLDVAGALGAFDTAAKLAPERTDFYRAWASTLRAAGKFQEAEALLRKRIAVAPDESDSLYALALTLLDYNVTPERSSEAEASLQKAVKLEPQDEAYLARLGRLLVDQNRSQDAIPYLEQAQRLDPMDVAVAMALARGYHAAGRAKDAAVESARIDAVTKRASEIHELEDSLKLQPKNSTLYLKLAAVYDQVGEADKAATYRQAADMLVKDPNGSAQALGALADATQNAKLLAQRPGQAQQTP